MRLKVYQAPSMSAAMAMVRDELGSDALILAHRAVDDGVELTAAQEHSPSDAITPQSAVPIQWPAPSPSPAAVPLLPTAIARSGTLRWHGVPAELAARLGRGDLATAIAAAFQFDILPCRPGAPPLMVVGPDRKSVV